MSSGESEWRLFPQTGYEVISDESVKAVAICPSSEVEKRTAAFFRKGLRTTAAAVMMTHRWLTPHLLLFLRQRDDGKTECGLFSTSCHARDNIKQTLQDRVNQYLMAPSDVTSPTPHNEAYQSTVGSLIGVLWVGGANDQLHPTPYLPTHITRPREQIRLYQVQLPGEAAFTLPSNYTLKAVPLCDLSVHNPPLSQCLQQVPYMLSRFVFSYYEEGEDDIAAAMHFHGATPSAKPRPSSQPAAPTKTKSTQQDSAETAQRKEIKALAESLKEHDATS